jgi:hypothetical protein
MTSPVITDNRQLAERARQLAGQAPNGSAERKSALVAAVALAEASTPAGARAILAAWEDAPAAIRQDALDLIERLTLGEQPQIVPAAPGGRAAQEGTTK